MRVIVTLHGIGQVSASHMEIVSAEGAVVGKSRASLTAGIADELLLGVGRGREEGEGVFRVRSMVKLRRQAEARAV